MSAKAFCNMKFICAKSRAWKKYTLHNEKVSSWLTQEIQSNIISKLENQARVK
jgi:hypothetical protein